MSDSPNGRLTALLEMAADRTLQQELAGIRAKATFTRLLGQPPEYTWRYAPARVVRNATAALVDLKLLATEDASEIGPATMAAREFARAWESLAILGERTNAPSARLNAAVGYEFAGYQANAICLAKELVPHPETLIQPSFDELSALFIQRLYLRLLVLSRSRVPPSQQVEATDWNELAEDLGILGLDRAARFFLTGNRDWLRDAVSALELASQGFGETGAVARANLATSIRSVLPVMDRRSTWTILGDLPDPRWQRYLKVLARGLSDTILTGRSVSELWPSQLDALSEGLISDSDSKVLRMPTSAGKTRIAEIGIAHTLVTHEGSKCLYIAPYRALVNELETTFVNLFSDLGFRVSSILGSFDYDELEELFVQDDDLLIVTPEKLDLVFRLRRDLLEAVRLVILDEGHLVEDLSRGAQFELLVTRLRRQLPSARFVFLSAVVPQQTLLDFARWLGGDSSDVIDSDWRPSIQRLAKLEWSGTRGRLRYYATEEDAALQEYLPGVLEQENLEFVNPETSRVNRRRFPEATNKSQVAAALALRFKELGPVLVFCAQTDWAEAVGRAIDKRLLYAELSGHDQPQLPPTPDTTSALVAHEWLGPDHVVSKLLTRGIAIHHGRLPDPVRQAVESDYRARRYRIIVATNTLAQGVNLPIRTVVVHSTWRREGDRPQRLSALDYWNIVGRAGRAGEETEGTVVHIAQTRQDHTDFEYFRSRQTDPEPLEGALTQVLRALVDKRIEPELVGEVLDSELLALLVEEATGLDEVPNLDSLVTTSLVGIQAEALGLNTEQLTDTLQQASERLSQRVPTQRLREVYSSTGLPSASCDSLRESILAKVATVRAFLTSEPDPEGFFDLCVEPLLTLEEIKSERVFPGSVRDLLTKWIQGIAITEIASEFADQASAYEVSRFIEDQFGMRLPWGTSGYVRIASNELDLEESNLSLWARFLSSMVKFGVPTPEATWAMSTGIPSRIAAIRMGDSFRSEMPDGELRDFRRWLAEMDPVRLQEEFGLVGAVLEDTVRALSRSQRNVLLTELRPMDQMLPLEITVRPGLQARETGLVGRLQTGQALTIARDYGSRIDRNAMVLRVNGDTLGYFPRRFSQLLAPEVDTGMVLTGTVSQANEADVRVLVDLEAGGPSS